MSTKPTPEGLKRYPATAGYFVGIGQDAPCTCSPSCVERCAGECGCEACSVQFMEFCDVAGRLDGLLHGLDAEIEALAAYRSLGVTPPTKIIHRPRFDGR